MTLIDSFILKLDTIVERKRSDGTLEHAIVDLRRPKRGTTEMSLFETRPKT